MAINKKTIAKLLLICLLCVGFAGVFALLIEFFQS